MELRTNIPNEYKDVPAVYGILNTVNGKWYVGMTGNLYQRYYDHKKASTKFPIAKAIKKYGFDKFKWFVFAEQDEIDRAALVEVEADYIAALGACGENGYNCLPKAQGVRAYGPDWAERMKAAYSNPEVRKKCGQRGSANPMFGRSRRGERVGGAVTPLKGNLNGMFGRDWREGKTEDELRQHAEKSARHGESNGCYGSRFEWHTDGKRNVRAALGSQPKQGWSRGFTSKVKPLSGGGRSRAVRCIDTGEVYASLSIAAKETGAHQSKISLCCAGKRKKAKGLSWEYA